MSLVDKMMRYAGKDGFQLDTEISLMYIARLIWRYGLMMARGRFLSVFYRSINSHVFIGKKVTILEKKKIQIAAGVKLHDGVYIDALSKAGVQLGQNVVLGRNTRIECTGTISSIGRGLKIGDRSTFGSDCFFGAAGGVDIGADVIAGQYIRFHSENHNFDDTNRLIREQGVTHKGIYVGNNCWLGAGAVFLDGAELGDGCVVAANAVVTKKFPANSVIGGVPARLIRMRCEV